MTIEWCYRTRDRLDVLSLSGHLGADTAARFQGAVGWVLARGTGPVVLDLTDLHGWSVDGQVAVAQAARRLADVGRQLELAAIPADGSLVPAADHPAVPVHCDLPAALAAHQGGSQEQREWRTAAWPGRQTAAAQSLM
ncbi:MULTISPECIES: STAS domain-containing protein [Streptomyces]|uniref:STAS domain-containing protein n=1 Tax=Streptomyces TaxID=1883 RepID=UPI0022441E81|nr:STAS domain-containing protein [Streptomyces griseolus]MCW8216673.1 STAS domain-containing protein [Streptomyces griseolus]